MPFPLIAPQAFNPAQSAFVQRTIRAYAGLAKQPNLIAGIKDIASRHLMATDGYARIVALRHGADSVGRMDRDMPSEGTAAFAAQFVQEDQALLHSALPSQSLLVLNVHYYGDGLQARLFEKRILWHRPSQAALGLRYRGLDLDLGHLIWLLHDYMRVFGMGCSLHQTVGNLTLQQGVLTQAEQAACFFLLLNWREKNIQAYLDAIPQATLPRIDSMLGVISEKLDLPSSQRRRLRDMLIGMEMQAQMPEALFQRLIGSNRLSKMPI